MTPLDSDHPSSEQLEAFGLGRLDDPPAALVHRHLESCTGCRAVGESLPDDELSALVRQAGTSVDLRPAADTGNFPPVAPVELGNPLAGHPRYRVLDCVGAGGMGVVYRAEHLVMERTVALKVIHHKLTEKPALVERFRREVKAAAGLNHPNIVTAYDADQAGDRHFLVMEYVPGTTLARLVKEQGPLPPERACDYVRQAAMGLQHAHERGLVHRDIKPDNLMLTAEGQVKILDFGLARLGHEAEADITDPGTVMGTVDFLAPEQADDPHQADIRADIYSLGCTLYYLLTGRPPFAEGTVMQKLKAHAMREAPSLAAARSGLPPGLDHAVGRMLAKDPRERFQTPAEVGDALASIALKPEAQAKNSFNAPFARASGLKPNGGRDRAGRPRPIWVRRLLLAGAALLLVFVAVGVYRVATDRGDIVIQSEDPDVEVVVSKGGKTVSILDGKSKQQVTLHTGEYTLAWAGAPEGL